MIIKCCFYLLFISAAAYEYISTAVRYRVESKSLYTLPTSWRRQRNVMDCNKPVRATLLLVVVVVLNIFLVNAGVLLFQLDFYCLWIKVPHPSGRNGTKSRETKYIWIFVSILGRKLWDWIFLISKSVLIVHIIWFGSVILEKQKEILKVSNRTEKSHPFP